MSGLETLSPDQRAVLQLILAQGRGYDELAATLRLDAAAVRERALAGALALAPADDVDAATRERVVDYLLGQQDDGERLVTFADLGDSPAAARWAQALRERLAGIARDELPEVPQAAPVVAGVNGGSSAAPDPALATAALAAIPPAPVAQQPASAPPGQPPHPRVPGAPSGPRPSRLGGAILIAGIVALAVVLAIVLIGNGDGGGSPASTSASTPTQPRAQTQTTTTGTGTRAQARTIGGAVLRPLDGGSALGAALIQQSTSDGRRLLAVEAARLPGNSGQDFYGIWLQGAAGNRFLGFVPRQVRSGGTFTVSSALPRALDLSRYSTVLITTEGSSAVPTAPGATVLSGSLRLAG